MENYHSNNNSAIIKNKWVSLTFIAREWRMSLMADRIMHGFMFEKVNGEEIKIEPDATLLAALSTENIDEFIKVKHLLRDTNGNKLCLGHLGKAVVFGGKGIGVAGDDIERFEVSRLNTQIRSFNKPINIILHNKIYENIIGAKQTKSKRKAKSDIELFTATQTLIWISHKAGNKPKHFQQWAGVATFKEHPETISFVRDVEQWLARNDTDLTKKTLTRNINDNVLKQLAMYGNDFSKEYGINNVTAIMQGNISLIENDSVYEIKSSAQLYANGELPLDDYEPCFVVRLDSRRNDMGLKNSRFLIYPTGGRRSSAIII